MADDRHTGAPVQELAVTRDYIQTEDGELHVRRAGHHSAGKTPLFLFHPSPNNSRAYEAILPILGRHRLTVAVDTPGFGESFRPTSKPGIADYARWLSKAPLAMGFERVDVLGQFTGAATASHMARHYPGLVRRLVLAGPPMFTPAQQRGFLENAWPMRPRTDGGNLMYEWGRVMARGLPDTPLDVKMDTFVDFYRGGANAIWGEEAVAIYPLGETLAGIRQRTLVIKPQGIHGDSAAAFAHLPNAELAEIQVSGYAMMSGFAALTATVIDAFLGAADAGSQESPSL